MPTFYVDSDMTEKSATFLANKFTECSELIRSVKSDIDDLVANGYKSGSASNDFIPFVDKFNTTFETTAQGLEGISQYVRGVGNAYTQTDESLGQSLRG